MTTDDLAASVEQTTEEVRAEYDRVDREYRAQGVSFDGTCAVMAQTDGLQVLQGGVMADGHWGQYLQIRAIEIVDEMLGSDLMSQLPTLPTWERPVGSPLPYSWLDQERPDFQDVVTMVADAALDNANHVTKGGVWEFEDGEFWLNTCQADPETDEDQGCQCPNCEYLRGDES